MSRFDPFFDLFATLPAIEWSVFMRCNSVDRARSFAAPLIEDTAVTTAVRDSIVGALRSDNKPSTGALALYEGGVDRSVVDHDSYRTVFDYWFSMLHVSATLLHELGQDFRLGACAGFKLYSQPCSKTCAWLDGKVTTDQALIERFSGPWHMGCNLVVEGEDDGERVALADVPAHEEEHIFTPWDFLRAHDLLTSDLPKHQTVHPVAALKEIFEADIRRAREAYESRGPNFVERFLAEEADPTMPNKSE